jgi:ketosteroid isomerase-like protein
MSQENVELVRKAVAAFNARDTEAVLSFIDPEVEFESAAEHKTYRGIQGMRQYREDSDAVMEGFHTEGDQFLDAGGDRVVHLYRIVGEGAGSGVPVSRDGAILWQLQDGRLFKGKVYLDKGEALEAAGLTE